MDKTITQMRENLNQWKPIPFWSWNGELDPQRLKYQIAQMKDWGIGGFFMHARGGLTTEYMSEHWMHCVEECSKFAQELQMDAWLYDENGWPSGFAGGKVLEMEDSHDRYLEYSIGQYDPNADIWYILGTDKLERIFKSIDEQEVLNLYIGTSVDTVDILNPKVTNCFLQLTHEKYKKHFGGNLKGKIRGIFTDEPQYHRAHTPYTNMIAQYWQEKYGEDIFDHIGLLFVEKTGYQKFRYRYWKAMQHLMLENFAKPVYHWCEENGIILTGHHIEETSLGAQLMCCGGVMPFYEYMQIPGIDWLFSETSNTLPQHQLGSVAAQLGKKQILTESFAGCGWQISPRELKRIAEFQFVYGVNLLCHHLLPYEEYGQRKRDWPSHFSEFNPWIPLEFKTFNNYFTRLGKLISDSTEQVNVAILHPMGSAYLNYKRGEYAYNLIEQELQLQNDISLFAQRGVAYHFLDEVLLSKYGFVNNNQIGCGLCKYDYLIIPHVQTMEQTTVELLQEFSKNGGKILILGENPTMIEAEEACFDWLSSNCDLKEIQDAQPYHVANAHTDLHQAYRSTEDAQFLFVVNASKTDSLRQHYDFGPSIHSFRKLDLLTLESQNVPLTITLEPGESALLFPSSQEVHPFAPKQELCFVPKNADVSFAENVLLVDTVRFSTDGEHYSEPYPCMALFQKFLAERMERTIWLKYEFMVKKQPLSAVLKTEYMNTLGQWFNGYTINPQSPVDGEPHIVSTNIGPYIQEGLNEYVVKLFWFQTDDVYIALFGKNVGESSLNKMVYNNVVEAIQVSGDFGVWSDKPIIDAGDGYRYGKDFWIGRSPKVVTEPVADGLPFISGKLVLKQKLYLDCIDINLRIHGNYLLAYVTINGVKAGTLLFSETINIAQYAHVGENDIEVTYILSKRNQQGPHHWPNGIARSVAPPELFEFSNAWQGEKLEQYIEEFELLTLNG